jgi:hypothetical protein
MYSTVLVKITEIIMAITFAHQELEDSMKLEHYVHYSTGKNNRNHYGHYLCASRTGRLYSTAG